MAAETNIPSAASTITPEASVVNPFIEVISY
jgi:hypothetical protein